MVLHTFFSAFSPNLCIILHTIILKKKGVGHASIIYCASIRNYTVISCFLIHHIFCLFTSIFSLELCNWRVESEHWQADIVKCPTTKYENVACSSTKQPKLFDMLMQVLTDFLSVD